MNDLYQLILKIIQFGMWMNLFHCQYFMNPEPLKPAMLFLWQSIRVNIDNQLKGKNYIVGGEIHTNKIIWVEMFKETNKFRFIKIIRYA